MSKSNDVSIRQRRDNLIVDGRQVVSLISVHGRSSLSDVYGLIHFSLVPVGFMGPYFSVLHRHCRLQSNYPAEI